MFRRLIKLQSVENASCFLRFKRLVEGSRRMSIQIV